ncbi:MAG TPA: 3-phosphoshikimate 1-carboxyvinyltransferase, partial [Spirochaetota bacterium]|nr:3-phosphoshikimate 1-carboxyvinyltransferase [Spirochaetota bacterium]
MKFLVKPSMLSGSLQIPGSKSHTIRALVFGLLAGGTSEIIAPLESSDTLSCIETIRHFGAEVSTDNNRWTVEGTDGNPSVPDNIIDVGNSGTTLYIAMGIASLVQGT